jgi:RNA polymerase sigma-70 factor (ECF subfamily)
MTGNQADSNGLMDRLKGGDPGALAELFSRHRPQLRRMVALRLDHRLQGRVSPSDVLQEAYIDALRRVPHYLTKPEMPFFGWLRLIVGQRLVDIHRQHLGTRLRDASQEVSFQQGGVPPADSAGLAAGLVGHLTSPSQAALRNEACAQLEEALNRLDPLDREVLTLRHFEELGNNEVAELLGIQRAAASKRYVRALARLKEVLATIPGFFDEQP